MPLPPNSHHVYPIVRLEYARRSAAIVQKNPRAMASKKASPKLAAPVDKLLMVTPYPRAKATMNETSLSTLVPAGTPIVIHLYTG